MPDVLVYVIVGVMFVEFLFNFRPKPKESFFDILVVIFLIGWMSIARQHLCEPDLDAVTTVHVIDNCPVAVYESDNMNAPIFVNTKTNEVVRNGDILERWDRRSNWSCGMYFVLTKYPIYKVSRKSD